MLWEHLWHLRVIVSKELLDWTCFCFFQGLPTKDESDWEKNALALFGRTKIIKREVVTLISLHSYRRRFSTMRKYDFGDPFHGAKYLYNTAKTF